MAALMSNANPGGLSVPERLFFQSDSIGQDADSLEQAKRWWASEEYKGPKALRQSASTANLIVVEGV